MSDAVTIDPGARKARVAPSMAGVQRARGRRGVVLRGRRLRQREANARRGGCAGRSAGRGAARRGAAPIRHPPQRGEDVDGPAQPLQVLRDEGNQRRVYAVDHRLVRPDGAGLREQGPSDRSTTTDHLRLSRDRRLRLGVQDERYAARMVCSVARRCLSSSGGSTACPAWALASSPQPYVRFLPNVL